MWIALSKEHLHFHLPALFLWDLSPYHSLDAQLWAWEWWKERKALSFLSVPNPDHPAWNGWSNQLWVKLNLPMTGVYKLLLSCLLNLKQKISFKGTDNPCMLRREVSRQNWEGLQDILLTQSVSPFTSNTLLPILNPPKREQRREGSSGLWDQELGEEPEKGWRPHKSEASGSVFARWELDFICHKVFQ